MAMTPSQSQTIQQLLTTKPDFADAIQNKKVSLKRYNSDPPRYELHWPDVGKDIPISVDGDELWSWATVQKAIFKVWKVVTEDMKPRDWHDLLTILNDNRADIDQPGASEAASVLDTLEHWIEQFATQVWSAGDLNHRPLYKNGYYYFRTAAFETHGLYAQGSRFYYQRYKMPRSKLYEILGNAGAKSVPKKFKKSVIRVWQIAEDFNKPPEQPQGELIPEGEEGDVPGGEKGETPKDGLGVVKNAPEGF